jgi:hypothetical protein
MEETYVVAASIAVIVIVVYLFVKFSRGINKVDETQRAVREVK